MFAFCSYPTKSLSIHYAKQRFTGTIYFLYTCFLEYVLELSHIFDILLTGDDYMNAHLLFITSHYFYPFVNDALKRLNLNCRTTVVPYNTFSHIPEIYRQHQDQCDAVLISGTSAKRILELGCPNIDKPVSSFQVDSDALHRDILRFAMERDSLDFSRIAMDFMLPLEVGYSVADFLKIEDMPKIIRDNEDWMQHDQIHQLGAEELILQRITDLWNQKAIDSVICMYSSIIPRLRELGIPFRCPFLSDPHLKRLIRDVLIKIELNRLHNNHPAIIQIFPPHTGSMSSDESSALEQCIQHFTNTNLIDSVVQITPACCTMVTTLQVVRYLTDEFQSCRLSEYLKKALDFPVIVAYGIGTSISHAMNNVQIASREAKILELPFAVDSNGNLLGPMNSVSNMVITQSSLLKLGDIANRASLSTMTIQKIMAILRSRENDKITIQELAGSMKTTLRNANRIMNNLQSAGFAVPVYTQVTHSRGRPIRVFMINFPVFSE